MLMLYSELIQISDGTITHHLAFYSKLTFNLVVHVAERKIHPMQKIINYMYEKEMRPLELLRSFDKEGNFLVSEDDFIARLNVCETSQINS